MAASSFLRDIDATQFCTCPICSQNFQEPKLLPCLHRYCSNCLHTVIQGQTARFRCHVCKHACDIPSNGAEGFKTDEHMKLIVLFFDIQMTFASGASKDCVGCSCNFTVAAYCFKCHGYLCLKCYNIHDLGDGMNTEHHQKILPRKDVDPNNFTLDELAFLTEAPKCHVAEHDNQYAIKCCHTCENLPVCGDCIQRDHKRHSIDGVTLLAEAERNRIDNNIAILRREMKRLENLNGIINNVQRRLDANVTEKRKKMQSLYERESSELDIRLKENSEELKQSTALINDEENNVINEVHKQRDDEMHAINEKYQTRIDSILVQNENERQRLKRKHHKRKTNITSKEQFLKDAYESLADTIATEERQHSNKIEDILEHSNNTLSRLKNLDTTVFSIFGMSDDWKDVLYLPDICVASKLLITDVLTEFPELEDYSDFPTDELKPVYLDHGTIPESEEYVVNIEGINSRGWQINGMTSVEDGSIVITGKVSDDVSHITVINAKGKHLRQPYKKLKSRRSVYSSFRYCAALTETKVATTCQSTSSYIGLFDVRNPASINRTNINEVTAKEGSATAWRASCIATCSANKHIFVGSFERREVYVFTDQLKHSHTLILPDVIRWPRDMNINKGNLIVCDDEGGKAFLVTMPTPQDPADVLKCNLICELPKPGLENSDCTPICVCTDTSGFIYMLWDATIAGQLTAVLVQYSHNGRQLLTKRPVDGNARSLATVGTREGEKLLIATERTGKLYSYGLVKEIDEE